jgi:anti-anti-sigma factor
MATEYAVIDEDALNVSTAVTSDGALLIAASGYLDDRGAEVLVAETCNAIATGKCTLCIDLAEVALFNCSGARRLLAMLEEIEDQVGSVELVGVRPPLEKALELAT